MLPETRASQSCVTCIGLANKAGIGVERRYLEREGKYKVLEARFELKTWLEIQGCMKGGGSGERARSQHVCVRVCP